MTPILITLATAAFAGDCRSTPSPSEVARTADDALLAFADLDEQGFVDMAAEANAQIGCLDEPLSGSQAAAVHRVNGVLAFFNGDDEAATAAFAAARDASSTPLSPEIAPDGGALANLWEDAARWTTTPKTRIDAPAGMRVWVDGTEDAPRLGARPVVVQAGMPGALTFSAWLAMDERVPYLGDGDSGPVADADGDNSEDSSSSFSIDDLESGDYERRTKSSSSKSKSSSRSASSSSASKRDLDDEPTTDEDIEEQELADLYGDGQDGDLDLDATGPEEPPRRERKSTASRSNKRRGGGNAGLWIATGISGGLAAASFGTSMGLHEAFQASPSETGHTLTNTTYFTSLGLAAVTAGLFTAAIAAGGK